jgi:hypothetical protein
VGGDYHRDGRLLHPLIVLKDVEERRVLVDGQIRRVHQGGRDPAQWEVCVVGAHPGYITWETYLHNQEKLRQNLARFGETVRGAPREGPALLGGVVICGRCGRRMRTVYRGGARRQWDYVCLGDRDHGQLRCWSDLDHLSGADVSAFVVARCPRQSRGAAKLTVTALRSLLGFLHLAGEIQRSLTTAVPSVAG